MRTTLDIPEDLMDEAKRMLGYKSKTDVIVFALTELVKRKRIEELTRNFGKIKLEIDVEKSRRRGERG